MPWPLRVRQRDFRPLSGSVRRAENEPFGVFEFAPTEAFDLDLVERTLRGALDEVDGVDAVVFPESCVPVGDARAAGGAAGPVRGDRAAGRRARDHDRRPTGCPANWVHLGVHVGGCWAHYRQNKHHRWFLDESQINQYHLAGALHPSVRWWEAMEVPRRSLQFLELSEGLTLVAVVCEDLARLDEVAELIRDVGPTLVVTILLDGPQLASRWTARYAGVLADDPGTAVLTLTANGMVERSRPDGDAAVDGRRAVEGPHPRAAGDRPRPRRHRRAGQRRGDAGAPAGRRRADAGRQRDRPDGRRRVPRRIPRRRWCRTPPPSAR